MSFSPSDEFNPYHKWLGIPPDVCPPNHYRLLGLEPFEEDPEVIATAADRQMSHIKSFSTGPFARVSQQVLNELAQARVCLLNDDAKQQYDAQLRAQTAPVEVPRTPEIAAPLLAGHGQVEAGPVLRARRRRPRKKTSLAPFAFVLLGAGAVVGLLYYAASQAPVAEHTDTETPPDDSVVAAQTTEPAVGQEESADPLGEDGSGASGGTQGFPDSQAPSGGLGFPSGTPVQPPPMSPPDPLAEADSPPTSTIDEEPGHGLASGDPQPPDLDRHMGGGVLGELFDYLAIPDLSQTEPVTIMELADSANIQLDLQLVIADYIARSPRQVFLHPAESGEWLAYDEAPDIRRQLIDSGEKSDVVPFARLVWESGKLFFQWLNDPTQRGQEQRLRHCLLRLRHGNEERVVQLRRPIEESAALDVGRLEEKYLHVIETDLLKPLPPTGAMLLALKPWPQFPRTKHNQADPDRLKEDEQLFLQFERLSYAGVGAYWQQKGRRLTIGVSPGFRLESAPNDIIVLSRRKVTEAETKLVAAAKRTEKDHAQRVKSRQRLQSNLTAANNLNIRIPGGGTTPNLIAQKRAAIDKAKEDIAANEARIAHLDDMAKAIKSDMNTRIPALTDLVGELEENALIGFELYVPAGAHRVVIYRHGMNADPSSGSSSQRNRGFEESDPGLGSPMRPPFGGLGMER